MNPLFAGVLYIVAGIAFAVLSGPQFFGFGQERYILVALVGLGLPLRGAWIWARYYQAQQQDSNPLDPYRKETGDE